MAADFLKLAKQIKIAATGSGPPVSDEQLEDIRERWRTLSIAYAGLDPAGRLQPAEEFPGYLTGTCGQWRLFVPWTLVSLFPDDGVLRHLIEVGLSVAIPPPETICISGSSTTLGSDIAIGDIDFCQYVAVPPALILQTAASFRDPVANRVLVAVSYGEKEHYVRVKTPEWQEWERLSAKMSAVTEIDEADRFMAEFLERGEHFGLLPVSIVVLASDPSDRRRGAARHSYVFQEAIAVNGDGTVPVPAWTLVDPAQLGDYIDFLRRQMDEYRTAKPIKAVKRALSLVRTIRLHDLENEAIDLLESEAAAEYVRNQRQREVAGWMTALSEPAVACINAAGQWNPEDANQPAGKDNDAALGQRAYELIVRIDQEIGRIEAETRI
jgi:hypothetical protein